MVRCYHDPHTQHVSMDATHVWMYASAVVINLCRYRLLQVWVLDALPGDIRAGGEGRKDHPADVIAALQALPLPIADRTTVQVVCWAPPSNFCHALRTAVHLRIKFKADAFP